MNAIQKKMTDLKQNTEWLELFGTISFCVYYGIMVVIKAFGYVSYEMFFKIAFVFALGCLGIKVCTTKYTMREFVILYLMLALSAICWLRVGEKNVLFITLSLWGLKNVRFDLLMKATVGIRIVGILFMILLSCVGLFDMQANEAIGIRFQLLCRLWIWLY